MAIYKAQVRQTKLLLFQSFLWLQQPLIKSFDKLRVPLSKKPFNLMIVYNHEIY
jgi:hypothetical protein